MPVVEAPGSFTSTSIRAPRALATGRRRPTQTAGRHLWSQAVLLEAFNTLNQAHPQTSHPIAAEAAV